MTTLAYGVVVTGENDVGDDKNKIVGGDKSYDCSFGRICTATQTLL